MFLVADFFSDKHEVGVQLYNCTATVKRESYEKLIVWDNLCKEFDKITLHNTYTLISVRLWNFKDFWPKIYILKGNHCILRIRGAPVHPKLGMILENKVVQKLKLEKNVFFYKKWSPKLIFLNDFFF